MTDIVDQETRSRMMSGIRGKDTKPEMALRRALHARGFRYRLHAKNIHGRPDLTLAKYKAVIFVHGCFWHRHEGCRYTTLPTTRAEFWSAKFAATVRRDHETCTALKAEGWRIATVWECALRRPSQVAETSRLIATWLVCGALTIEIGETE